jgi:hypothetical protein
MIERHAEKLGKKLLGENDVEAVLQRLDRLTQEEARTTAAQTFEIVHGLMKNVNVIMDGAQGILISCPCCVPTAIFLSRQGDLNGRNPSISRYVWHSG